MKVTTMSAPRLKCWILLASLVVTIAAARLGQAQVSSVGTIEVCYDCAKSFDDVGNFLDGPIFFIQNSSGSSITNGVLKINEGTLTDSFNVGTIAAGTTAQVAPGLSNDRGSRHTFFKVFGEIRDTSELGPNADTTQFEFTGRQGPNLVDSGVFTPATTKGPSLDGNVSSINFLGGPGDADALCTNCFDATVATLIIPSTFSVTVNQPLNQGPTSFDYAANEPPGAPTLDGTVDFTNSGTTVPPGITVRGTITWITDSPPSGLVLNQFDRLVLGTQFQGKNCLHQQIAVGSNLVFACLVTLYQCSPVNQPNGPFSGANCPLPTAGNLIDLTLEFVNEQGDPSLINGPGLIEGADNAQTCTPRPSCEGLTNIFTSIGPLPPDPLIKGSGGHLSIFVPFSTPR
jgi:hypothetical protein